MLEQKALWKQFKKHTDFVKDYLVLIDDEMRKPSSESRGKRIAELSNKLQMANDSARRVTLELDWNGKPLRRSNGEHK